MADCQMISPEALLPMIGHPERPALVDVCIDEDVAADPYVLPGAFRHAFSDPEGLARRLAGRDAVVICQKGKKLSQGVAAWLRSEGVAARALEGGNLGWPGARLPLAAMPNQPLWVAGTPMFASVWLLRRFIDADARVLFVQPEEVPDVATRFGAEPLPSFGVLSARFGLGEALDTFARRLESDSLTAQLRGIEGLHTETEARCAAALPLFDALYQGCRA